MVEHACHYDIILEHKGRLLKIQVKASRQPKIRAGGKTSSYLFQTMRMGKGERKDIQKNK